MTIGIIPAGTANLLAKNLGIPHDLGGALEIALPDRSRRLDVGVVNGEHFAVMAGAGFDARMIDDADRDAKAHLGRLAYVRSGAAALRAGADQVHVLVDGVTFFEGRGQLRAGRERPPGDRRAPRLQRRRARRRPARRRRGHGRGHRRSGCGCWPGWRCTAATAPRFVHTIQGRTIDVRFDKPVRLRARRRDPARRPTGCSSRSSRRPSPSGCPRGRPAMSTARLIPETWELSGDDAWRTLRRTGRRRLLRDAFQRMRWSDGFSHSRSLAFLVALAAIQGIIALVGVASAFGESAVSDVIVNAVEGRRPRAGRRRCSPQAVTHAQGNGSSHHYLALDPRRRRLAGDGHHRHGPAGAGPEPPLRRGAGPPLPPQVRPGAAPGGQQRRPPGRRRSACSPSGAP